MARNVNRTGTTPIGPVRGGAGIVDGSIVSADIASGAVGSTQVQDGSLVAGDMAAAVQAQLAAVTALQQVTVAVAASDTTPDEGAEVTLTATVSYDAFPGMSASGDLVEFTVGETSLGTAALVAGVATLATTALPAGASTVTATYAPPAGTIWEAGSGTVAINAIPGTTTVLTVDPTTAVVGASVSLSATVAPVSAPGPVSGTVAFRRGETQIGPEITVTAGVAATEVTDLPEGVHSVTATFIPANPSAWLTSVSSPAVTVTITAA